MKLEQLSDATVLRPDIAVKRKKSAPSADTVPPATPVVKTQESTVDTFRATRAALKHEIATRSEWLRGTPWHEKRLLRIRQLERQIHALAIAELGGAL